MAASVDGVIAAVLLRQVVGVALGAGVGGIGLALGVRALADLRLRLAGRPARAVVVRTEAEPGDDEVGFHDWTVVDLTTVEGRVHRDVRLRSWSTVPPRPGRELTVYHRPDDPTWADRSRPVLLAVRLLSAPAVAVLGAVVAVAVVRWS